MIFGGSGRGFKNFVRASRAFGLIEVYNLVSWLEVTENETQNNVEPWQNAAVHAYKI